MIRFHLSQLIADAQFKSGRRITLLELTQATGLSRITLSRMLNTRGYSTSTDTIDKLCKYFGCSISDVATYLDDDELQAATAAPSSEQPLSASEPTALVKTSRSSKPAAKSAPASVRDSSKGTEN